jgi:hypothetical protein
MPLTTLPIGVKKSRFQEAAPGAFSELGAKDHSSLNQGFWL